ncbi:MAG: efflux RND transporter periplasmic adaptor subunit [Planctomycetaceae bacterium]|nr:efflux RND transporter periplasmic adaptor subunit [Planctomycetaceae bacterium]
MKKILIFLLLVCIGGGAVYFVTNKTAAAPATILRKANIQRGDLLSTVNATGTLEPEEVVNVGAQVAGLIVGFGDDPASPSKHVDYCSVVEQDAVLALIDPTFHQAAVEQAEATLESSEANLKQLEAKLQMATNDWKRAETLYLKKTLTDSEYDAAKADYESARASVDAGKAAIRQNKAMVNTAKINLGYCTIKSPVRGTVIERRVNIGQTVVASLNAPSLFLIAKDLTKMQVWTSVNEADIGRIRLGMPVRFSVDAFKEDTFHGTVTQIRMNAQMTQNVVTYTVVVTTDNPDGKLLPYLTANVHFEVDKRPNVLLVPNAALRWVPDETQLAPSVDKTVLDSKSSGGKGRVWVVDSNNLVKPLDVTVGATDGIVTEVAGDDVKEGLSVVTGEEEASADKNEEEASNPFLPKFPNRHKASSSENTNANAK